MQGRRLEIFKRIMSKVFIDEDGCWIWRGGTSGDPEPGKSGRGYGRISIDGHSSAVHRVMWTLFNGYLPRRRTLDHLCEKRLCCNPDCLESVSNKENSRRRSAKAAERKRLEEERLESLPD